MYSHTFCQWYYTIYTLYKILREKYYCWLDILFESRLQQICFWFEFELRRLQLSAAILNLSAKAFETEDGRKLAQKELWFWGYFISIWLKFWSYEYAIQFYYFCRSVARIFSSQGQVNAAIIRAPKVMEIEIHFRMASNAVSLPENKF